MCIFRRFLKIAVAYSTNPVSLTLWFPGFCLDGGAIRQQLGFAAVLVHLAYVTAPLARYRYWL